MRKIVTGALLAILAIAAAPAYAQTNTELLRDIDDTTEMIADGLNTLLRDMGVLLGDLRVLLDRLGEAIPLIESNSESIKNIEAAIMGEACGAGTVPTDGICTAPIVECDGDVVSGTCLASVHCGEGTILHVDTCIADVSISYCGEGTIFHGGVCVAAGSSPATTPQTQPTPQIPRPDPDLPIEPTIVTPETTNRYVVDGDTIRVEVDGRERTHTLAFAKAPELSEAGGRDAARYLDGLCGSSSITVMPEIRVGTMVPAIIHCGGVDASHAMVLAGHAVFDGDDCAIRDFIDVAWTQELCSSASMVPTMTTTPVTTTPVAPTPTAVEPIRGSLAYREFTFPVTVGDIWQWERAADGDPMTTATISCLFGHTPSEIDAVMADNIGGVYHIDLKPDHATTDNRLDTSITMTTPKHVQLFNQRFAVGDGTYVVFDRAADIIDVGFNDGNYLVVMSMADWDDASWSDANDIPTEAEKTQKVLDIEFTILTDIINNSCEMTMAGVLPGERSSYTKTLSLAAAPGDNILVELMPYDVSCRESIVITAVAADASIRYLVGYDIVHVSDNETGPDATLGPSLNSPGLAGLSFESANFVVGASGDNPSRIAPANREEVNMGGVALMSITYQATSEDVCTWTERAG